jgi:hypothetical protein
MAVGTVTITIQVSALAVHAGLCMVMHVQDARKIAVQHALQVTI